MYKKFTLIELIVVVVVLGILTSIIIPNISNVNRKGESVAISSNVRNLQTVSDMFSIDNNGLLPTVAPPKILMPESVNFVKLYPEYEKNLPKTKNAKYWIDVNGEVWGSEADGPSNFYYNSSTKQVSWTPRTNATGYQVYEIVGYKPTAAVGQGKIQYKPVGEPITETKFQGEEGKAYAVSSIDDMGHISAPIGTGAYIEYTDTLESVKHGESGEKNRPPVARITVLPSTTVDTDATLTWSYEESIDADGDEIVNAEWKNKQDNYKTEGMYLVELRVQDSVGNWSDWTSATINVSRVDYKPIANFTYSPATGIHSETNIMYDASSSKDDDGDSIVGYEWQVDSNPISTQSPNGMLTEGNHTVKLRVQDSRGNWSDWFSKTFFVDAANHAPTAVIGISPSGLIDTGTAVTFNYNNSTDPDGDTFQAGKWIIDNGAETSSPNGTFTAGDHTVKLRVQDSRGLWSEWSNPVSFHVNAKPLTTITRTPGGTVDSNTSVSFTYTFADPDGHTSQAKAVEWRVDGTVGANPNKVYTVGSHTVEVRVQDEEGSWSDWASNTFSVAQGNRPPTASITVNPNPIYTTTASVTFGYTSYVDPDGDAFGGYEWQLDGATVRTTPPNGAITSAGTHNVKMRVKDNKGNWSDWYSQDFEVIGNQVPNAPTVSPTTTTVETNKAITVNYSSNGDPDGDAIVNVQISTSSGSVSPSTTTNPNGSFTVSFSSTGSQTVYVRVQDSKGSWSNYGTYTFSSVAQGRLAYGSCTPINGSYKLYMMSGKQYKDFGFNLSGYNSSWDSMGYTYKAYVDGVSAPGNAHENYVNVFWANQFSSSVGNNLTMKVYYQGKEICSESAYITQQWS